MSNWTGPSARSAGLPIKLVKPVEPYPAVVSSRAAWLDRQLERVCLQLQLTNTQYRNAEIKYHAVGDWLSARDSELAPFAPEIFPQGSMLLGTTLRPWRGIEYDLDLVCQLHSCAEQHPLTIYNWTYRRMASNETYLQMLEKLKRCFRLNYAGEFHLDILPACPNGTRSGIIIPDRRLQCWIHTNPRGFAEWFFERCRLRDELAERMFAKAIEPLPSPVPSEYKYPLQRVVQLMKRHRDEFFDGGCDIARSVIITTLAGYFYEGQRSLSLALEVILDRIYHSMEAAQGIPRVENPIHPDENFADTWDEAKFEQFKRYIGHFRAQMKHLLYPNVEEQRQGLEKTVDRLGSLFGASEVKEAIRLEAAEINIYRETKRLSVTAVGAVSTSPATPGTVVQRNHFFGT
jgi:Second Messenger Oligonucleotide or Dinucleotide Synthetase domain